MEGLSTHRTPSQCSSTSSVASLPICSAWPQVPSLPWRWPLRVSLGPMPLAHSPPRQLVLGRDVQNLPSPTAAPVGPCLKDNLSWNSNWKQISRDLVLYFKWELASAESSVLPPLYLPLQPVSARSGSAELTSAMEASCTSHPSHPRGCCWSCRTLLKRVLLSPCKKCSSSHGLHPHDLPPITTGTRSECGL